MWTTLNCVVRARPSQVGFSSMEINPFLDITQTKQFSLETDTPLFSFAMNRQGVTGCQLQSSHGKEHRDASKWNKDSTVPGTETRRWVKVLGEVRMADRPEEAAMWLSTLMAVTACTGVNATSDGITYITCTASAYTRDVTMGCGLKMLKRLTWVQQPFLQDRLTPCRSKV